MPDIITSPPPAQIVSAVETSNLPARHKTHIREWYERTVARAQGIQAPTVATVAHEATSVIKADIIAAVTGYALAKAEEHFGGMDIGSRKNIPIDGLGVAGGAVLAFATAGTFGAEIGRGISAASSAVMSYRTEKAKQTPPGTAAVHGEGEEDGLLAIAKNLDFGS